MNAGIDFVPNLVGSTPIAPFSPSPRLDPSSLPFPYLPLPFLHPLFLLPYSFTPNPLLSPQIQLRGLGKRSNFSPAESGGAPVANAFARILG